MELLSRILFGGVPMMGYSLRQTLTIVCGEWPHSSRIGLDKVARGPNVYFDESVIAMDGMLYEQPGYVHLREIGVAFCSGPHLAGGSLI